MGFIRRKWSAAEADNWTKEDTIAVILSPLVYILLTLGTGFSMLLMPVGFILLGIGIVLMLVMIFVINPKLSAISTGFEKKQQAYLEELERQVKWED